MHVMRQRQHRRAPRDEVSDARAELVSASHILCSVNKRRNPAPLPTFQADKIINTRNNVPSYVDKTGVCSAHFTRKSN